MIDDLKFAGKLPVVINKNGDTRDIFAPIKSASCDITIVSNKILTDLYTDSKTGIKVKVEKYDDYIGETTRLFEGYMTPNTYTQHLSPNLDNIDMTAIDPLSVLKYTYINDILEKAKTISMGELLGKALASVMIDCNEIWIENTVSYKPDSQTSPINFADMIVQTNNFWDEGGDASSVYDAVSECLRLFGYTLTFTGEKYIVYLAISDHTFGETSTLPYRYFTRYRIEDGGYLISGGTVMENMTEHYFKHTAGDWTTIDDNPTVSIDDTYDRIAGVASTKIPNYSLSAFDMISAEERDRYDAGDLNVQRNKIKGYDNNNNLNTDDEWYYLWNGVYESPEYGLTVNGVVVNGYANINQAYAYMSGQTGHPNSYGGILNFYGGESNPIGTNKDPQVERVVDVKKCITVFAPDNGVPPEFLEREDLKWDMDVTFDSGEEGGSYPQSYDLYKPDASNSKYGTNKTGIADAVSYSQKYENITISKEAGHTLSINLSQSYSRTGIKQRFSIFDYSEILNRQYMEAWVGEDWRHDIIGGTPYTYPHIWQTNEITVRSGYFQKYSNGKSFGIGDRETHRILPVWDKRKIELSIELRDGTKYQFNGKEWIETAEIGDANAFYLTKLMNNTHIFNEDFKYDCIEMADGSIYSLKEEGQTIMFDESGQKGRVTTVKANKESEKKIEYYGATGNDWMKNIEEVGEGLLSILLPSIDAVNVLVKCDIYHSNLLGITGNSTHDAPSNIAHWVRYQTYSGDIGSLDVNLSWMPINGTYIKAEHLDIDISLGIPETNLGQMFGESDIKYQTSHSKRFRQSWDAPTFQVNTRHQIVNQSHSYVIIGNELADANKFVMGEKNKEVACRPENYVMQGYKNYWSTIRKTYNRVLVPHRDGFSNHLCYIEVPDLPDDGHGRWLMVVSDSVDVKTNRHTINAVEDYGLKVKDIENYTVIEIPRRARNDRYNLPSVKKS